MNNQRFPNIKGLPDSVSKKPIWKKPIRVGPLVLAPIDESIVEELHIDETTCWFEELTTGEGILLKVSRCSESSAIPRETSEDRGIRSK
jgi:hypothetical protein